MKPLEYKNPHTKTHVHICITPIIADCSAYIPQTHLQRKYAKHIAETILWRYRTPLALPNSSWKAIRLTWKYMDNWYALILGITRTVWDAIRKPHYGTKTALFFQYMFSPTIVFGVFNYIKLRSPTALFLKLDINYIYAY